MLMVFLWAQAYFVVLSNVWAVIWCQGCRKTDVISLRAVLNGFLKYSGRKQEEQDYLLRKSSHFQLSTILFLQLLKPHLRFSNCYSFHLTLPLFWRDGATWHVGS